MDIKKSFQNQKGFTLIELLVVIVIIGILATGSMSVFNSAQAKARDSQRISDLEALKSAVEQYYTDKGEYPGPDDVSSASEFREALEPYLSKFPVDPKNSQGSGEEQFVYSYSVWDSASGVDNQVYVLTTHFESDSNYNLHNFGTNPGEQEGRYVIGSNVYDITNLSGISPTCDSESCGSLRVTYNSDETGWSQDDD